eukprot:TRINITY_DN17286_c0_g1_i1.p1 TRINITY_DN17286_c0_g1~~TRINITY_DN17286_c0_g1_i1.p1  ORF type:complete len:684 (+),score=164.22 TRINITY_DN17286_c0_g1_i1:61-2112(+)
MEEENQEDKDFGSPVLRSFVIVTVLMGLLALLGIRSSRPRGHSLSPAPVRAQLTGASAPSVAATVDLHGFPASAAIAGAGPDGQWRQPRSIAADLADVADRVEVVALGKKGEWALMCPRPHAHYFGPARCWLHLRRCAKSFNVYTYPTRPDIAPGTPAFVNATHAAAREWGWQASSAADACIFIPGIEVTLKGDWSTQGYGQLFQGFAEVDGKKFYQPMELMWHLFDHGQPPFKTWLGEGSTVPAVLNQSKHPPFQVEFNYPHFNNGKLMENDWWGLNHVVFQFNDLNHAAMATKGFGYPIRGMSLAKSASDTISFHRFFDVPINLPRITRVDGAQLAASRAVPASNRSNLLFFAGAGYGPMSPRWQLRELRKHGEDVKIVLYCLGLTRTVVTGVRGRHVSTRRRGCVRSGRGRKPVCAGKSPFDRECLIETNQAKGMGLMPGFQQMEALGGNARRAPDRNLNVQEVKTFVGHLASSTFCVVSRGFGYHSFRLTESLQAGCIPLFFQPGPASLDAVKLKARMPTAPHWYEDGEPFGSANDSKGIQVVAQQVYPFNDTLNWAEFTVTANEDDLFNEEGRKAIVDKLRKLKAEQPDRVNRMQRLAQLAHDEVLGDASTMTREVLRTWHWRTELFAAALDHCTGVDTKRLPPDAAAAVKPLCDELSKRCDLAKGGVCDPSSTKPPM